MTLNDKIVELRTIANLIGGNHLTKEEAEQKINDIADGLVKIQEDIALATDKVKEDINYSLLGVNERYLYLIKSQRSFDELNCQCKEEPKEESNEH